MSRKVRISQRARKLSIFSRQLKTLLDGGVNLIRALDVLSVQADDPRLSQVVTDVATRVAGGVSLSKAMAAYPGIFSRVFLGMVQSGEATGQLPPCLGRLSDMLERESKLQDRLVSALTYPMFVLGTSAVLTLFVFYVVIPNFVEIFKSMHVELPLVTRLLISITDAVRAPGFWCGLVGGGLFLYVQAKQVLSSPRGSRLAYRAVLQVPVVGPTLRAASLARYCWVLESLLSTGVAMTASLRLGAVSSGNPLLEQDRDQVCSALRDGESLSVYYGRTPQVYSQLMPPMVALGEETGNLAQVFRRLGTWFNMEAEDRLDLVNATIEPVLMTGLAIVVGTIVIAIFLPLYSYLGNLGV